MNARIFCLCGIALLAMGDRVCSQTTTFSYQGRLNDRNSPATGSYDFRFRLASDPEGNNYVGSPVLTNALLVSEGLFTATLDFGSAFTGSNYWLEVSVRTNGGTSYSTLSPLQPVTSVPYAVYAMTPAGPPGPMGLQGPPGVSPFSTAGSNAVYLSGFVGIGTNSPSTALAVQGIVSATGFNGNAAGLTGVNGAAITTGSITGSQLANGSIGSSQLGLNVVQSSNLANAAVGTTQLANNAVTSAKIADGSINAGDVDSTTFGTTFWKANGNSGTAPGTHFIGTTDNQPLELKVNGQRTLRFEPNANNSRHSNSVNVIAGSLANSVKPGVYGATIAGGGATALIASFTNFPAANQVMGDFSTVGGGEGNTIGTNAAGATIAGGNFNTIYDNAGLCTIGGGDGNAIAGPSSLATIAGGEGNRIGTNCYVGTIGGGVENVVSNSAATVSGGWGNMATASAATVGGGNYNTATGPDATVSGGYSNVASGVFSMIPGGRDNRAQGAFSMAAGLDAHADHDGSFVWSSGYGAFSSTGDGQFAVKAAGGVRLIGDVQIGDGEYRHLQMGGGNSTGYLFGSYPYFGDGIHLGYNFYADADGQPHVANTGGATSRVTVGYGEVVLAVGSVNTGPNNVMLHVTTSGVCVNGTVNNCSDRNVKQDFTPISPSQILEKVAELPVSEWSYKTDAGTRHIGPVAQDFYSTFNIGTDDKHIAPIDEGGVALAAIQGLNRKVEEKEARIQALEKSVNRLEAIVAKLTTMERGGLK